MIDGGGGGWIEFGLNVSLLAAFWAGGLAAAVCVTGNHSGKSGSPFFKNHFIFNVLGMHEQTLRSFSA